MAVAVRVRQYVTYTGKGGKKIPAFFCIQNKINGTACAVFLREKTWQI